MVAWWHGGMFIVGSLMLESLFLISDILMGNYLEVNLRSVALRIPPGQGIAERCPALNACAVHAAER